MKPHCGICGGRIEDETCRCFSWIAAMVERFLPHLWDVEPDEGTNSAGPQ